MFSVSIKNERQKHLATHTNGPLELGRGVQRDTERIVIEDLGVSRDQMRVEMIAPNRLRLENLGQPLSLDGETVPTGISKEIALPFQVRVGATLVEFMRPGAADAESSLKTIARPQVSLKPHVRVKPTPLGEVPSAAELTQWFERLMSVQMAAAGSGEFYEQTARAVVDLIGLDKGMVLLRRGDRWETVAEHSTVMQREREVRGGSPFSRRVLAEVVKERRTFFQSVEDDTASLVDVEAVAASPVFDATGDVIGAVYGSRYNRREQSTRGIRSFEAQFTQLLAGAVSAGLARMEREAEAARSRVLFEQFASSELARELERNPKLLEGHEQELTIMFGDLRGSSGIAERLAAKQAHELLADVMDGFTDPVMENGGIIIDYYGDGMAAMWNAPVLQEDHAARAYRAAQESSKVIYGLSDAWNERLGHPLGIGIGLHTGVAQVGNAGSRRRLKYGPRGHTVNLASRIEGATKFFGVAILATQTVQQQLPAESPSRRLGKIRVVGIDEAVAVYELPIDVNPEWLALKDQYERALGLFEAGDWSGAIRELSELVPIDTSSARLSGQATLYRDDPPEPFDGILEMKSK